MQRQRSILCGALVLVALTVSVADAAGELWVSDHDGPTLELWNRDGGHDLVVTLPAPAVGIAVTADGGVWVSLPAVNELRRLSATGALQHTVATGNGLQSLAVAADGSLWAVRPATDDLLQYSETGALLQTIPVGVAPFGVAIGADGRIWVTSSFTSIVSRFESDGSGRLDVSLPFFPTGVAVAPDGGSVWVASKNFVHRIDPSGVVTHTLTAGWYPRGIAIDAVGQVWVTNLLSGDVSRFTTAGQPIDTIIVGSRPWGVSVASDGGVWIHCGDAGEVWRLAPWGEKLGAYSCGYPHSVGDSTGFARAVTVVPNDDDDQDGTLNLAEATLGFDPLRADTYPVPFLRGDSNNSGSLALDDAVATLGYLFGTAPTPACVEAADTDDNGSVDLVDPVLLLQFLLAGGPTPLAPFPTADVDPAPFQALPCMP